MNFSFDSELCTGENSVLLEFRAKIVRSKKRVLHPTSRLNCISSYRGILGFDTKILQNNSGDVFHAELDLYSDLSAGD